MNSLEKQVLRIIGENVSSPDVFKDTPATIAPIRDSINDAIEEVLSLTGGYTEDFTIPLVADKTFYRIKFARGTFAWVKDAWLYSTKRRLHQTSVAKLNMIDPRWMEMNGTPEEYFLVGHDVIGFWRKPSTGTDVVQIRAVVVPSPYTDDGERIKLRDSHHRHVVNYAASEYFASRGDASAADQHFGEYLKGAGLINKYSLFQDRNTTLTTAKTPEITGARDY